jgi:hypothetical protein
MGLARDQHQVLTRPPGFLLSGRCAIRRVPASSNILDVDRHDIAVTKLAVDRQIEHREVSDTDVNFEFRPD